MTKIHFLLTFWFFAFRIVLERGKTRYDIMGKIEENKQQKKTRLMDTAYELYTSQGIVKTTIEDIARKAGIAKGTFYLYFKDKYDLQEKLIAHKAEQLFDHAVKNSGYEACESAEDKILSIVDDILDQLKDEKLTLKFIYKNLNWGVCRRTVDKPDSDYLPFLISIIGAPEDTEKLEIAVYTIFELVSSTCYSVILEEKPCSLESYKPYLHKSIRAIIAEFK